MGSVTIRVASSRWGLAIVQEQKTLQSMELNLARQEAREIQRSYPDLFKSLPVPVRALADALGLKIQSRPELRQRAQLELLQTGELRTAVIAVQANLGQNIKRFAIAHEIGHAILLTKYPRAAREWEVGLREEFADVFATELLASPEVRTKVAPIFRALDDPLSLLRLASRLGLSPSALLTIASQERSWLKDLDRLWLRIKCVANAFTNREPKLRIVSAHYDRARLYIPTNQSLVRFAGSDSWVSFLPPGSVAHQTAAISVKLKQNDSMTPKFQSTELHAELSAVRLQPVAGDLAAYLIVLAKITRNPASLPSS